MNTLLRLKAIATSAVTYLVALTAALTIVADEVAGLLGADHAVVVLILRAVAWIGTAIAIIRRVTPVLPAARGLLPTPAPVTEREEILAVELSHAKR